MADLSAAEAAFSRTLAMHKNTTSPLPARPWSGLPTRGQEVLREPGRFTASAVTLA